MVGIARRKRTEGWAVDNMDAEGIGLPSSLRQRLAEDNRLWLIVAGIILITAVWLIFKTLPDDNKKEYVGKYLPPCNGAYNDSKHLSFTLWFRHSKSYSESVIDCGFAGPGNFRLVMPSNVSPDEIEYTSKMAAILIEHKLQERPVVNIYGQNISTGERKKVAKTEWSPARSGYILKFEGEEKEF